MKNLYTNIKWIIKQCKGYVLLIALLIILGSSTSIVTVYRAIVTRNLLDNATSGLSTAMINWTFMLGLVIVLKIFFESSSLFLTTYTTSKLTNILEKNIYDHILHSKWSSISEYHSVILVSKISNNVTSVVNLLVYVIPSLISALVMFVGAFFTLMSIDYRIALLTTLVVPIFIFVSKAYKQAFKNIYEGIDSEDIKYTAFMQESIHNSVIVKAFCNEDKNINKLSRIQNKRLSLSLNRSKINVISNVLFEIGSWLGYFLVFSIGSLSLLNGKNSFGDLTAMLQLFNNVQAPISKFSQVLPKLISSFLSLDRLINLDSMECENYSKPMNSNFHTDVTIEFNNVSFRYNNYSPNILNELSFKLEPSDILALIGPSGKGKTTLIRLLLCLTTPTEGEINIIQNSAKEQVTPWHRNIISYVPQGNTLFSGTIEENILYGNTSASKDDIDDALKMAFAYDFVNSLKNGISTKIGEKGLGLSEGQAQRLAIARAFLRKSPILILDEATSALDQDTEAKILDNVKLLDYHPTCIIITHRPYALNICNKIVNLDD